MKKLVSLLVLLLPLMASAQTPEEKGMEIAVEGDKRDAGFGDMTSDMVMTLKNANGDVSIRKMRSKNLEVEGDGDKGLTILMSQLILKARLFYPSRIF